MINAVVKKRVKASKDEKSKRGKVFVTKNRMLELVELVNKKEDKEAWLKKVAEREQTHADRINEKRKRIDDKKSELKKRKKK
ncbi:hypothetical protein ROZALSC1DRAFT_27562 [Rozella allomycis CSF55]|uniref:Uncharacterized protein n=1 Tax=Rozella allomycis (strain CSF55) TaxID=988480 RepID=A0A075AQZ3_ROZAC|nr:hypothetical protein O9G_001021 [Rozella allomycis CSF55]RKP20993.1 hypothetical protein ROZALSC1DRAFT_27562 [Rozella allomycis CSF55]|eukprot:EPZ31110.1 hypothetical protein O9G_001021 [Rozella allomycis CSF55]